MFNRKIISLMLVIAMGLTMCGASVFAANEGDTQGEETQQEAAQPENQADTSTDTQKEEQDTDQADQSAATSEEGAEPAQEEQEDAEGENPPQIDLVPDSVGELSFANIGPRMRERNYNLLALDETIASLEVIDYEQMQEDIRDTLNQTAQGIWFLTISGNDPAAQTAQSAYDSMRDTFEDLKDGKLQRDGASVIRQLENAQDQVVVAAESLYIALIGMEQTDQMLDRSLEGLDRTVEEMELRYSLGQISALTLQQVKGGRTALISSQQTLNMNITTYKTQLELMIGAELTGKIKLKPLPQVTTQQVQDMNLEQDLAVARDTSYMLFDAQKTVDDAKEDRAEEGRKYGYYSQNKQYLSAEHTWQAAQYTYGATVQNFEATFNTLYLQVKDKQQIAKAAQTALAVEQANYASIQLKYEQGSISKNKLLDAADQVSSAQETVTSATIDLFSTYHSYRWAVDYGILN